MVTPSEEAWVASLLEDPARREAFERDGEAVLLALCGSAPVYRKARAKDEDAMDDVVGRLREEVAGLKEQEAAHKIVGTT